MAFGELRLLQLKSLEQGGEVFRGGNGHRTAGKQRGGQGGREPMDAHSCLHDWPSSFPDILQLVPHYTAHAARATSGAPGRPLIQGARAPAPEMLAIRRELDPFRFPLTLETRNSLLWVASSVTAGTRLKSVVDRTDVSN